MKRHFIISRRRRWKIFGSSELKRDIDTYIAKLSTTPIDVLEAARAHSAKLAFEDRPEWRLRSLQTMLDLKYGRSVVPAISELMVLCADWPDEDSVCGALFLIDMLKGHWGADAVIASLAGGACSHEENGQ